MLEKKEAVNFDDKIVITPVELYRDRELNGECYALFGVMKSFGPRAEAKVSTLAARLGWSVDRVKKYQAILRRTKWIVLLREGDSDRPRLWWMCRIKGEVPPQEVDGGGGKNRPPQKQAPSKTGPLKTREPQNTPPKQKKALKTAEGKERGKSKSTEEDKAKATLQNISLSGPSALKTKFKYMPDFTQVLSDEKFRLKGSKIADTKENANYIGQAGHIFGADLLPAWLNYLKKAKPYWADQNYPLVGFIRDADNWMPKVSPVEKPRQQHQAAEIPVHPVTAADVILGARLGLTLEATA